MKRSVALVLAAHLAAAVPSTAGDQHLVPLSAAHARLTQKAVDREAHLAAVRSWLRSPAVAAAASRVGVDAGALTVRAAALSDAELQDLAQRAAALETDPVAGGLLKVTIILLVIVLVTLVVIEAACANEACTLL